MYKINIFVVLLLVSSIFATNTNAQNLSGKFRHLTIENGLSHNNVYTLAQDKTGFMWIGTQTGLDKYNGYGFLSYHYASKDTCSLISSNFGKLLHDSQGRLWVGTYRGGLNLYYPKKNYALRFYEDPEDKHSLPNNLIRALFEDSKGNIWIGTGGNGFAKYDEEKQNFVVYQTNPDDDNSLINNNVSGIMEDRKGNLWVATSFGLSVFNPQKEVFISYMPKPDSPGESINDANIQTIFTDKAGTVWIGTRNGGLNRYEPDLNKFNYYTDDPTNPYSLKGNRIQSIYEDSYGRLWVGTYTGGLHLFNPKTERFTHFQSFDNDPHSLNHNRIEVILEDNAQNLWVATRGGGISILDLKPPKFTSLSHSQYDKNSLPEGSVMSIVHENENNIWFGTLSGLCRYDRLNDEYLIFKEDINNPNSLSNNRVRALMIDSQGSVWAGTYSGGLNKIELIEGEYVFTHFMRDASDENTLISNQINVISQDSKNVIWIGTSGGLSKLTFDEANNPQFQSFRNDESDTTSLSSRYITDVYEDRNGTIWIATSEGLNRYSEETNSFVRYNNNYSGTGESEENAYNTLAAATNNKMWVGTDGAGLFLFDTETGDFNKFHDPTFNTNNINAIAEDTDGKLWLSTSRGISHFCPETGLFISYGINDGLEETGFTRNGYTQTPSGAIYFGNISGVSYIEPENIEINSNAPTIALTDFKIFNDSYFTNKNSFCSLTPENLEELVLSYRDYVISFEFASLDYTAPMRNRYEYMLEGFNEEWIQLGERRYASFTSLPAGTYTLKVRGTNNDGLWSDEQSSLAIKVVVKPPFWQTTWFYAVVIVVLLVLIYGYIKRREASLRKDKIILEQKVRERTEEVEAQKEELIMQAEALEKANVELEKLSIVASETNNAVTILDAQGNFEWVNDGFKRLYGWESLEHFIQKRGKNVISGDFAKETKNAIIKCMKNKKPIVYDLEVRGKGNIKKWLQTTWTPILDAEGELLKLIAIDSDISELKKAEFEILEKKAELENKNYKINLQNENIKSSIRYAKTIQQAILPPASKFSAFADHFILYRPKDIVSGDFYWYYENEDYHFVCVSDCTGHGVPGAFMSMIGTRLLDGIVIERKEFEPKKILELMSDEIIISLNQNESDNRDGMDLCFVRISKHKTDEKFEVVFEGSKRELLYYGSTEGKIKRVKGSRKSIGGIRFSANTDIYRNKTQWLQAGDILYLSTDGYIDQCNVARKRFSTLRLVKTIEKVIDKPLSSQKQILETELDKWQGDAEQRDDIALVGIKL